MACICEHLGCRYRGDNCDKLYFTLDIRHPIESLPLHSPPRTCTQIHITHQAECFINLSNQFVQTDGFDINRKALIKQKHHGKLIQFILCVMDTCENVMRPEWAGVIPVFTDQSSSGPRQVKMCRSDNT